MQRLTLTPQCSEIKVNNGSQDGAVDLFSYGPETEDGLRPLGTLYVVGHRQTDSGNMGYITSLIAALARREYYAQPGQTPREAFGRMLRKINEVVEEFFKSGEADLNIGIFALAGTSVMVSKLEKFRILLSREGQTVDILNNLALFSKEHVQKHRFSSIISGSIQAGDRICAYYPSKAVVARERYLKPSLAKLSTPDLATKLEDIGRQHQSFGTAMLCIDIIQQSAPVVSEPATPAPAPTVPQPSQPVAGLAWQPRQGSALAAVSTEPAISSVEPEEIEQEVPQIIATEFALGTRRNPLTALFGRLHVVRFDGRGKAVFLGAAALILVGGVFLAKSVLFADPQAQKLRQTIQSVKADFEQAQAKIAQDPAAARQIIVRGLATLGESTVQESPDARQLAASLLSAMDTLDNAQTGTLSLFLQPDQNAGQVVLTTWSSASDTLWMVARDSDNTFSVTHTGAGTLTALGDIHPTAVLPFKAGVLVLDAADKKMIRVSESGSKPFTLPIADAILAATVYNDIVYTLTDHGIMKTADLDTDRPVTKEWLVDTQDLATGAAQLQVNGNIWTLGTDGILTWYYKGKKVGQAPAAVQPSGSWRLLAGPQDGQLAVANADTKRIYLIDAKTGALVRTLKIDTQQQILDMSAGPDNSVLFLTKDNKIWQVK